MIIILKITLEGGIIMDKQFENELERMIAFMCTELQNCRNEPVASKAIISCQKIINDAEKLKGTLMKNYNNILTLDLMLTYAKLEIIYKELTDITL